MTTRFIPLNYNESAWYGVYDTLQKGFVTEPESTWSHANILANCLNTTYRNNPDAQIDLDELHKLAMEAKA